METLHGGNITWRKHYMVGTLHENITVLQGEQTVIIFEHNFDSSKYTLPHKPYSYYMII